MMNLFAQLAPPTFWNEDYGSSALKIRIALGLILGIILVIALLAAPTRLRRPVVSFFVFISGLYYVLLFVYPSPIQPRPPDDAPRNFAEKMSFLLADTQPIVTDISNILAGFLLGLGIYSLLRVHGRRIAKQQKDWGFSVVLLLSLVLMAFFGLLDWSAHQDPKLNEALLDVHKWTMVNFTSDLLFDGLLQQMDAAMFSLIAFYILSAAYRAFRVRSPEATILLATALIVMLSVMPAVQAVADGFVKTRLANGDPNSFLMNLQLTSIADWLKTTLQSSSIRGIEFGVGIGLLAMGLRIWLSLERTGEAQ